MKSYLSKSKTAAKKSVSVFLALLMVLSCWVFFAPEAEAVNADGTYYYKVDVDVYDSASESDSKGTLYGKDNNGTGKQQQIASEGVDISSDGKTRTVCKGSGSSFPTQFDFYWHHKSSDCGGVSRQLGVYIKLSVSKDNSNWVTIPLTGKVTQYNNMGNARDVSDEGDGRVKAYFSSTKGVDNTVTVSCTPKSGLPYANSVSWVSSNANDTAALTLPKETNKSVSKTINFNVFDQYGVRMSSAALNSLKTTPSLTASGTKFGTIGTDSNKNIYYSISAAGTDSYSATITAKNAARGVDFNDQVIFLNPTCNGRNAGERKFTLYDPSYTFSFNGNGGSIAPNESVKKYYYSAINANEIPSTGVRTGYEFIGMYKDARFNYVATKPTAGTTADFTDNLKAGDKIDVDRTYYAAWWAKNVKVTFVDNAGNFVAENTGKYDKNVRDSGITAPDAPEYKSNKEGSFEYEFKGWKVIDAKEYVADGTQVESKGVYGTSIGNYTLKGDTVFQAVYEIKSTISYNITFWDNGGENETTKKYNYGKPITQPTDPTMDADNYFTYTFKGWHKVEYKTNEYGNYITDSNGNYIPVEGEQKNAYIINKDGYLSTNPTSDAADAVNRRISVAGDDDFTVRSDAEFVPVFEKTFIEYTVNFEYKDALGNKVVTDKVNYHYGDALDVPEVPDSYTTGGFRYPFTGWNTEDGLLPKGAKESRTYVASYETEGILAIYKITFKYISAEGEPWEKNVSVEHGKDFSKDVPKTAQTYRDGNYEYTFDKWLDQYGNDLNTTGSKDAVYTAQYTAKKLYTVTFMNEGEEFAKEKYVADATIVMPTETPTKAPDKTASKYTFNGWVDENGTAVTTMPENDLVLNASYTPEYINYTVKFVWKDKDGNDVPEETKYHYGETVTIPNLEEKGQATYKDNTYNYTFKGWDTDVSKHCTEDVTYTATYRRAYNYYKVEWMQESHISDGKPQYAGKAYMTDAFIYNEKVRIPTVPPQSKQTAGDEAYSMVLDYWYYVDAAGEKVKITRDTRITADIKAYPVYKKAAKVCKVEFFDEEGKSLGSRDIEYNTNLETYNGIGAPAKAYSADTHFSFDAWVKKGTAEKVNVITEDCKLQATYREEAHSYGEIVADKLPTFFENGYGTRTCTGCAKTETNVEIPMLEDKVNPTAKLFIKDASYESGTTPTTVPLPVALKNNLIIATVDTAEKVKYNENGKGSGTGKIEYFVSEGETARNFKEITDAEWKLRFDYNKYVAALKEDGLSDDEIKLAMSEFEANATAYVGDLENDTAFPEIVKDGATFIFYAKITDRKGNVNYVRSQPLTMDATAPVITAEGLGNGGSKFCTEVTVKVLEDKKLASVTVNGEKQELEATTVLDEDGNEQPVELTKGGQFKLSGEDVYTIAVTDESGNVTEKTVEILGGHTEKKTVTAPTCTEKGKTTYVCTVCGQETKQADETDALGHAWAKVKTVEKTCTEKGYDLYRCTRCGETEERDVQQPTGKHTFGEWIVTKKQTCSTDGSKYRVCSECGETNSEVIKADRTSHVYYRGVVTKPTCTKAGYTTHTCKYCKHSYTDANVEALGHEASGVWVITKEASCEGFNEETKTGGTVGERVQYCKRDGAADCQKHVCATEEIPVPGHSWKFEKKFEPTTTEQGYTLYKCANCDAEKKTAYTDKLEQHTVTFYGEDGKTEIKKVKKFKGETVLSTDATAPEKKADKTNKYTFSHWALKDDAENKAVEFPLTIKDADIELKAVYAAKPISYTIIFYTNKSGTPVQYKKVGYLHYGDEAKEIAGPSDYEDESANYKFAGWYPMNTSAITGEGGNVSKSIKVSDVKFDENNTAEYVAYFEKTDKEYSFTYAYDYANVIFSTKVKYGTTVNVNELIPETTKATVKKAPDAAFHYNFSHWAVRDGDASVNPLKADGLAIAKFTANKHNLVSDDKKKDVPATCTTEGTSYKKCSVCGYEVEEKTPALGHNWGAEVDGVQHCTRPGCDATKESDTRYTVNFYIEGKAEALRTVSGIKYGEDITARIPTPTKADNGSKTYTFKHWYAKDDESKAAVDLSEALKKITGDAVYVALFEESTKMVKVIYRVAGSTEALQVTEVEYGTKTLPKYEGVAPTSDKYDDYGHYVWDESHPWSVEEDEIPAEGITKDLTINANFAMEDHDMTATTMHGATCTEPMTEKFECKECAYTYTKKTGKPLGHNFTDLVERVEPVGEKAGYEVYKCTRCDETQTKVLEPKEYINFVITVVDTKHNPVEGAKVSIFDGETFVASNVTNAEGKVTFRVEKAKKYRVVIEGPDFDTVYGDITVNPDGSTSGNIPQPNVKTCSCTCHRDGLWPAIFRFFHKIIKMLVGEFVCCGNPDSRYYK